MIVSDGLYVGSVVVGKHLGEREAQGDIGPS